MSFGGTFKNDLLKLIFNAVAIANIADNASASPLTNLYLSLHTADVGDAGTQATNEVTYPSYARVALVRTAGGWTVVDNVVSPAANVDFPVGTGGGGTATHFAVGVAASGAGKVIAKGTIDPDIVCGNGIRPQLTTGTTLTIN